MQTHSFPPRWLPFAAALVMAAAIPARADIYSVGTDGCSHATIQQAVDAAEANPGEDFIRIPHSQIWNGQAIVINTAQTLWFEGYWSDCNTLDDSTRTTLDGAGGSAAPVIRIEAASGSVIGFDFLDIRNGDVSGDSGKGGGIWYRGNGTLSIKNGSIYNNTAGLGGGLYLEGTGTTAAVTIGANVGITGNVARDSGGGVFAEAVNFTMVDPNSIIAFNEAQGVTVLGTTFGGRGGGLVVNPTTSLGAFAVIGSSGVGSFGAIHGNTAREGGGVALLGESGSSMPVNLYFNGTVAGRPAMIDQNFASVRGGGLYADDVDASGFVGVHVWNATIEGNAAAEGSAMVLDGSVGAFNVTRPEGATPCPTGGEPCLRIVGNTDQDALGQPTGGAVILAEDSTVTFGLEHASDSIPPPDPRGTSLTGNRGGVLLDLDGSGFGACNLLISDNQLDYAVVGALATSPSNFCDSTIAGNTIGGISAIFLNGGDLGLHRVLLWQPGVDSLFNLFGSPVTVESTLTSEAASLGGDPEAVAIESPRFIDPDHGDYRLRVASPAIDYALPVDGDDRDVLGLARDQRIDAVPRPEGHMRDVGAHERSSLLPPVLNGDFMGDTNLWFLLPGHAGNYQVDNAPGSLDGSGSAQVAGTSDEGRLLGYLQCIHLPGPGTYALNGSARSEGDPQLSNPTALIWELRLDGGEGCIDGAITTGATHALGTQATTDQWIRPANPALISVTESEWNHNTSLTVLMAVYPNASDNAYNGLFDRITLEWSADGSDVIFADGFEAP